MKMPFFQSLLCFFFRPNPCFIFQSCRFVRGFRSSPNSSICGSASGCSWSSSWTYTRLAPPSATLTLLTYSGSGSQFRLRLYCGSAMLLLELRQAGIRQSGTGIMSTTFDFSILLRRTPMSCTSLAFSAGFCQKYSVMSLLLSSLFLKSRSIRCLTAVEVRLASRSLVRYLNRSISGLLRGNSLKLSLQNCCFYSQKSRPRSQVSQFSTRFRTSPLHPWNSSKRLEWLGRFYSPMAITLSRPLSSTLARLVSLAALCLMSGSRRSLKMSAVATRVVTAPPLKVEMVQYLRCLGLSELQSCTWRTPTRCRKWATLYTEGVSLQISRVFPTTKCSLNTMYSTVNLQSQSPTTQYWLTLSRYCRSRYFTCQLYSHQKDCHSLSSSSTRGSPSMATHFSIPQVVPTSLAYFCHPKHWISPTCQAATPSILPLQNLSLRCRSSQVPTSTNRANCQWSKSLVVLRLTTVIEGRPFNHFLRLASMVELQFLAGPTKARMNFYRATQSFRRQRREASDLPVVQVDCRREWVPGLYKNIFWRGWGKVTRAALTTSSKSSGQEWSLSSCLKVVDSSRVPSSTINKILSIAMQSVGPAGGCRQCLEKDERLKKLELRLSGRWSAQKDEVQRLYEQKQLELEELKQCAKALKKHVLQEKRIVEAIRME